jgi:hypothetical protein
MDVWKHLGVGTQEVGRSESCRILAKVLVLIHTRTIRRAMRALSKVNSIVVKTNKTKTATTMSRLTHMKHI